MYLTSLGEVWTHAYKKALAYVRKTNCFLAFNPGTKQLAKKSDLVEEGLKLAEILFVNKEEAKLLLSEYKHEKNPPDDMEKLLQEVMSLGPKIVVVTDGKRGSYVLDKQKNFFHQDIVASKVVERTGAGDAYSSGFLAAILYNRPIEKAMQWGGSNSTSVVGSIGAEAGLLKKEELEEHVRHEFR